MRSCTAGAGASPSPSAPGSTPATSGSKSKTSAAPGTPGPATLAGLTALTSSTRSSAPATGASTVTRPAAWCGAGWPCGHHGDRRDPVDRRTRPRRKSVPGLIDDRPGNAFAWDELRRSLRGDVARGERHHVPLAAEAVACGRQRLSAGALVQRHAVVRDLLDPARSLDHAEGPGEGVGRPGLGRAGDRRPGRGARPGAGRRAALGVLAVGVDDLPVGLGQDIADGGLLHDHDGRAHRREAHPATAWLRPGGVAGLWRGT